MKFTKNEIKEYNQKLCQIFTEYCNENNFTVHQINSELNPNFYMAPKLFRYNSKFKMTILDGKTYFTEHQFFDDNLKFISLIRINDERQQFIKIKDFWQYADDRLDKKGQVLFHRIITNNFQAYAFQNLIKERSDEQNWFYIKHIHDGERKAGTQGEFNIFFDFIKTQQLDTDEKIQNFYSLCKHSRNIIKRPEYTPVVCDFISHNISPSFHDNFEVLLGRKVKRDLGISEPIEIMSVRASQTISLEKTKCFEKIKFSGEKIPNINNLNSLNFYIFRAIKDNCMEKLGLHNILIVPFTSDIHPAKITFEFSSSNHRTNMPDIYINLLEQCSVLYDDKKGNYDTIAENVTTTINRFLLNQKLSKKDGDSPRIKL